MSADDSDKPKTATKNDVGNRTMQLDAFVDDMVDTTGEDVPGDAVLAEVIAEREAEDAAADGGGGGLDVPIVAQSLAPTMSKPPPLPPKRVPKWAYVVGALLVVLAIVAGVFVGKMFQGAPATEPPAAAEGTTPHDEHDDTTDTQDTDDQAGGGEPELVPIQLDTVTIGADEEGEPEGEPEGALDEGEAGDIAPH